MEKEYAFFMKTDVSKYVDEWIAIVGNKIVSHGRDVEKVYKEAKELYPKKTPLIARVPGKETMIL